MSVSVKVEITKRLRDWRQLTATTNNVELYRIIQNQSITEIANTLPETNIDLLAIKGLGPAKIKKFGPDILKIVADCRLITTGKKTPEDQDSMSVSQFLTQINFSLSKHTVRVRGEVYGSVDQRGKAIYFKIKDSENDALLSCFAWVNTFEGKGIYPKEGAEVILEGQAQIYPPTGRFSLQVKLLELRGEGLLRQAYEKLKSELEKSGAFNPNLKRSLPKFPGRLALVTAARSDAEADFLTHVKDHGLIIDKYDVRVEGIKSESEIVSALNRISQSNTPYDLVIITRGGGSLEALQGYNSKPVVQAVQGCRYPVISAVGHEKDVTLCDLVADVRVSTPTDAGKLIDQIFLDIFNKQDKSLVQIRYIMQTKFDINHQKVLDVMNVINRKVDIQITLMGNLLNQSIRALNNINQHIIDLTDLPLKLVKNIQQIIGNQSIVTDNRINSRIDVITLVTKSIFDNYDFNLHKYHRQVLDRHDQLVRLLEHISKSIDNTIDDIAKSLVFYLDQINDLLNNKTEILGSYNPDVILKRGYSIVTKGKLVITSSNQIQFGDQLKIKLIDGTVKVTSN